MVILTLLHISVKLCMYAVRRTSSARGDDCNDSYSAHPHPPFAHPFLLGRNQEAQAVGLGNRSSRFRRLHGRSRTQTPGGDCHILRRCLGCRRKMVDNRLKLTGMSQQAGKAGRIRQVVDVGQSSPSKRTIISRLSPTPGFSHF